MSFQQTQLMSEIIDEKVFNVCQRLSQNNKNHIFTFKASFDEVMSNIRSFQHPNEPIWKRQITGIFHQISQNIDLLVLLGFSEDNFFISIKPLKDCNYSIIYSRQIRRILAKQFNKKTFILSIEPFKIILSVDNGQWVLKSPVYSMLGSVKEVKKRFHQLIKQSIQKFKKTLEFIQKVQHLNKQQNSQNKNNKLSQVMRCYTRCSIESFLSIKTENSLFQQVVRNYTAAKINLNYLVQCNKISKRTTQKYFQNIQLYGFDVLIDQKGKYLNEINERQKRQIRKDMAISPYNQSKDTTDKFLFNQCYFLKKTYPEKLINQGGNSLVFCIKPQVYECLSFKLMDNQTCQKSPYISKYIQKNLVFKTYKNTKIDQVQKQNKISKQTQIIIQMKGQSCYYIPQYYKNIDKQSKYYQQLFMDHLTGQTLDTYLNLCQSTVSLVTKIYILIHILQGLRFLKQIGIVHLDVKQTNIIISKKLVSKIIDFDESYHYEVCGNFHKPKYTLMYASPQVVTNRNGRTFTEKSDIFSLGIMMHKIFYGKFPYFFRDQTQYENANFSQKLRQKTFYIPQENQFYGNKVIMDIIQQLILKSLDQEQNSRPYLDWTALILKCCLNYLISE